jgi:hypothetical protein
MISAASGPTLHITAQHGRKNVSTVEAITVVAVLALCHLDMGKAIHVVVGMVVGTCSMLNDGDAQALEPTPTLPELPQARGPGCYSYTLPEGACRRAQAKHAVPTRRIHLVVELL